MARKPAALLATAIALLVAPAAHAATAPTDITSDPLTKSSLGIAERYWGQSPARCAGGVSVWLYSEADPTTLARANATDCVIWMSDTSGFALRQSDPQLYCNVIAHEWGHLLGHDHSTDPNNLMYPVVPRVVPACADPLMQPAARPRPHARAARVQRPRPKTRLLRSARRSRRR